MSLSLTPDQTTTSGRRHLPHPLLVVIQPDIEPFARCVYVALAFGGADEPEGGWTATTLAGYMGVTVQSVGRAVGILCSLNLASRERVPVMGGYRIRYSIGGQA